MKKNLPLIISVVVGVLVLVGIISLVVYFSVGVGENYEQQLNWAPATTQQAINQHEFAIKNIRVKRGSDCAYTEIRRNGQARSVDCFGVASDVDILSNEVLTNLFGSLDRESFEALGGEYYVPGLEQSVELYIETNYGNKTIILSSNQNAPQIEGPLEDLVEIIEDIEEDLDDPEPTPVVTQPPTPTPAGATPTPTATPIGGGPTPSPTPTLEPGATPEPFDCSMLEQSGVTVSNIRCIDDQ